MPNSKIVCRPLLAADIGKRTVTRVDVREIAFEPGQATGRHKHPCPVISYIAEGTALVQEDGGRFERFTQANLFMSRLTASLRVLITLLLRRR
jgi:hypothetical protein